MNRITLTLALAAAVSAGTARAQNSAPVEQPASPAPTVVSAPAATAPAVVQAPSAGSVAASATQIVYSPKLPTAEELTNAAAAQGYTVERIVQTATQVVAFYRTSSGQTTTVAYQSLPPTGTPTTAPAPAVVSTVNPAPAVVVTAPPPTTVVYETAPRVVYYDYPHRVYAPYYYPRTWYPSVHFGFGYRSHHGGFHGGHRHHRHR